ncbi:transmembrane protein 60 [Plakobranchus ocellatus]|uniref:Transmembrane protein 60 n=1 Tax=Plakobranchus ocellatus TaxID=259542 RepID=A0AAV4DN42_9GAST|nr:transmembrane protein 60 [Plakobranchus ocellatus]
MAAVQKAIFSSGILLITAILFALRVDNTVDWNWFLIFIPLWLFDAVMITYLIVNIIIHFRTAFCGNVDRNDMTKNRKYGLLVFCVLKITFQILLCLRLEDFYISLYYVLIPLWIILVAGLIDNFFVLKASGAYR